MQFFFKDIEFCASFPSSCPIKAISICLSACYLCSFHCFLVSTLPLARLRMKMSACQWVAVEA